MKTKKKEETRGRDELPKGEKKVTERISFKEKTIKKHGGWKKFRAEIQAKYETD